MDPFAQDLLEGARHAHEPTAEDRARVRAKLAVRIGAGVLLGAGTAKALGSGWWSLAKTFLPFFLLVVNVGLALSMLGARDANQGAVFAEASAAASGVPAGSESVGDMPPAPTEPAAVPPPVVAAGATPSSLAARAPRPPSSTSANSDLEAEMALIASAQSAIARGDYAAALASLDEHQRSFPKGMLSEERTAARAVALCGSGRQSEGRALATAFLARHATSPLAPRVKSACGMQ